MLYKNIRPIYLPLARSVDTDAGLIPGKWKLDEDSEPYQDSVNQVFRWSRWQTSGVLTVHYGAINGISVIRTNFNELSRTVSIEPLRPDCAMVADENTAIEIHNRKDDQGEEFELAIVYTLSEIFTFKNAELTNIDGVPGQRPNPLRVLPILEAPHINEGSDTGTSTFDKVTPILNELNTLASYLVTTIRKHHEPQWAGFGMTASDMQKSGDSMWFIHDTDARIEALVAQMDIPSIVEFIKEIEANVKDGLPELAFDEIRKGQIATETVELQLLELITKIDRMRPNYDDLLRRGLRVCGLGLALLGQSSMASDLLSDDLMFDSSRDVLPQDEEKAIRVEMLRNQLEGMQVTEGLAA